MQRVFKVKEIIEMSKHIAHTSIKAVWHESPELMKDKCANMLQG